MKLTAVFEPADEGGYTCFVEEIPAAISQGETLEEAKANLIDALKLVLECQRELPSRPAGRTAISILAKVLERSRISPFKPPGPTRPPTKVASEHPPQVVSH